MNIGQGYSLAHINIEFLFEEMGDLLTGFEEIKNTPTKKTMHKSRSIFVSRKFSLTQLMLFTSSNQDWIIKWEIWLTGFKKIK